MYESSEECELNVPSASSVRTLLSCISIANLTLLAGCAWVSPSGNMAVWFLDGLFLRFCVVRELFNFECMGAWMLLLLLINFWTWSSALDGGDNVDNGDKDEEDTESRTRLLVEWRLS